MKCFAYVLVGFLCMQIICIFCTTFFIVCKRTLLYVVAMPILFRILNEEFEEFKHTATTDMCVIID